MALYSIVIPIYNEEQTLPELHHRLLNVTASLHDPYEVILVDDGSDDRSFALMKEIHDKDPRFKILRFSRNFGHQVAISAGLDMAEGDAVILMDGDLQDPPELLPQMAGGGLVSKRWPHDRPGIPRGTSPRHDCPASVRGEWSCP